MTTGDFTNAQRTQFAFMAIQAHTSAKGVQCDPDPAYSDLPDLLADLMHFCAQNNIDFTLALESARGHFTAEVAEEGGA